MSRSLCAAVLLLATVAVFSEDVEVQPEAQEIKVHTLHTENQQEWLIHEAVIPLGHEDSDFPLPPLALSEQPRVRNQGRRRRKRPRPTHTEATDEASTESLGGDLSIAYLHPNAEASSDERVQRPRSHRRRPYPPRFQHHQTQEASYDQGSDMLVYAQPPSDDKEEQTVSDAVDSFPKRLRDDHIERPEPYIVEVLEANTKTTNSEEISVPVTRSYRKPYKSRIRQDDDEIKASVSPQDIKALLKQHSGSLSLSEILQQKNLSLADFLRGNRNALNALTGNQQVDQLAPREPNAPSRRLPPVGYSSRRKNLQQQKPERYSAKVEQPERDLAVTRRLPSLNSPSRRLPSADTLKPQSYFNPDQHHATEERIRFVPSSPRRRTTTTTTADNLYELSTESIDVANSITPTVSEEDENEYAPLSPIHNRKKKLQTTENEQPSTTVPYSLKVADISDVSTTQKPPKISLKMQESSAIDPLQNTKSIAIKTDETITENRHRGKHMPQYRLPAENLSSNMNIRQDNPGDNNKPKSTRPRLPSPSLFLPDLRYKLESRRTTSERTVEFNTKESDSRSTTSKAQELAIIDPQPTEKNKILGLTENSTDFSKTPINPTIKIISTVHTTEPSTTVKYSAKINDEPMKKIIPLPTDPALPFRATTAGDELLEFLKTESGATRLARILSLRNMSLAELIQHRERGSSQQHLAEIFKNSSNTVSFPTRSTAPPKEVQKNNSSAYTDDFNNHIMLDILKSFKALDNEKHNRDTNIPSIQEMFNVPEDLEPTIKTHSNFQDFSKKEIDHKPVASASAIKKDLTESEADSEEVQRIFLSLREPRIYEHIPSFHSTPNKISVKAGQQEPVWYQQSPDVYVRTPSTSYYISDEKTTTKPTETRESESILLLEDFGKVHEVTAITDRGIFEGITNRHYNSIYEHILDGIETSEEQTPNVVKSAIIVSTVILGLAILGFLVIFVVCRWRQKRARRRFVDGIANIRARSPILMQQEDKINEQTLNPVLVNNRDLYKRELSDEHLNVATRRYYLWRTIRKTLRYK